MSYDKQLGAAKSMLYMGKWDKEEHVKLKGWDLWNLAFTAAPKKGTTVSHKKNIQHEWELNDDKDNYKSKEKTTSSLGFKHDDVSVDMEADNGQWSVKLGKPLVTDDWKVAGSFKMTGKPAKSLTGEMNLVVDSPDMSGTKLNMNITAKQEQAFQAATAAKNATVYTGAAAAKEEAWVLNDPDCKVHMNANIDGQTNIGAQIQYAGKLKGAEVGGSMVDGGNVYWLGYDHMSEFCKAGCLVDWKEKNFKHAYEARWFMKVDKNKQQRSLFQGMPLKWVASGAYKLSDKSNMAYMLEWAAAPHLMCSMSHQVDANWKLTTRQSFDMNNDDGMGYQLGMDITYAL